MKQLILKLIRLYQASRLKKIEATCRFLPSCSEYSYQAIAKYGILRGGFLSLKRIIRCHPFNKGGKDPLT